MLYTRLGGAGASVSRICLGCMTFGDKKWRPWVVEEDDARSIIKNAIESGINFFDTADMYSLGRSEEITGRAVRDMAKRDEVVIATKVFYPMTTAPNMGSVSRKHIVQGCEASLKRLGVDYIDLYYIHRLDHTTPMDETLAALDHLVHSGKVLYLGGSSMYAWQFAKMLSQQERNGWARFVVMQNHYNLIYREEEREMIPLCQAEGVGIIPWSPLARGILAGSRKSITDRESTNRAKHDALAKEVYTDERDWEIVEANIAIAKSRGVSASEVALAWLFSKPGVVSPIVGTTKSQHIDAAVKSLELKLTADEVARLEAPYRPHPIAGHS